MEEFKITCRVRNLCVHQITRLETLMGSCMRLESSIYPHHVVQMSSHWRTHLLQDIKNGCGLIWADRFTEKGHQIIIKLKNHLKRMKPGEKKNGSFLKLRDLASENLSFKPRIQSGPRKRKVAAMTPIYPVPEVENKLLFALATQGYLRGASSISKCRILN